MGYAAIDTLLSGEADVESQVVGIRGNRIVRIPLGECVSQTREINRLLENRDYAKALALRGNGVQRRVAHLQHAAEGAAPPAASDGQRRLRLGVLTAGAPAPGMNTAVRAAVRLALDQGHHRVRHPAGLPRVCRRRTVQEMDWMSVNGWAPMGGSELGTSRDVPAGPDLYAIARTIEQTRDSTASWPSAAGRPTRPCTGSGRNGKNFPAFNLSMVCLPATIDNNLPGTELSVGADTALNNIASVVDKIKQSAVAERRCYVVEVMGRRCGYLAMMSGLATGAERVYLHEEGITLADAEEDLKLLVDGFQRGKRLGLMIRNENANDVYDTRFMCALFEEEGGGLFDVRQSILGHLQQGGDPSPFDRIQATKLARLSVQHLVTDALTGGRSASFIGDRAGQGPVHVVRGLHPDDRRRTTAGPKQQWWLDLRRINDALARPEAPVADDMVEDWGGRGLGTLGGGWGFGAVWAAGPDSPVNT